MLTFYYSGVNGKMTEEEILTSGMVGKQVKLEFSPDWDELQKTVVFSTDMITRDVIWQGNPVTIPHEVLAQPLQQLHVGVYGVSADGTLVIPTVRALGPEIQPGANPSEDPGTSPELEIWAQLQLQLGDLTQLDTDEKESLVAAVNELAANGGSGVAGKAGATFVPNVSQAGVLSWSNDQNLENPTSVCIMGPQGEKGDTGAKGDTGSKGADGYTPVKGVDYYTDTDKSEFSEYIASELAKRGQLQPLFANSIEKCTDTSKIYVLPDGFIYAYMLTEKEMESGPAYTNRLPLATDTDRSTVYNGKGYKENTKLSGSGGGESSTTNAMCATGFIPVTPGDVLRIKGAFPVSASNHYIVAYNSSNARTGNATLYFVSTDGGLAWAETGDTNVKNYECEDGLITYPLTTAVFGSGFDAVRICADMDENTVITLNEEITEGGGTTTVTEYAWANTGHAFVPADYENRIVALETEVETLKKGIANTGEALAKIKEWDTPIYDANIPVFTLSAEKAAITEAEKTVEAVYAKYDALMAKYPNYITKTDLGMCSDGVTPVYRYDFREPEPHRGTTGAKEWSETKAKAIIISGIHWEWGGIFALYNALEELAENPELFHLRRNTHLIVIPVCNPYAVENQSVRNANQVEIHRNFEVDFIYPGEDGYIELGERSHGGTEPLSEVETQYIDQIMKTNKDAAFFLSCHSFQQDDIWGTGFAWHSPATYYMCNMGYRLIDKLSNAWMSKYTDVLSQGVAEYKTANLADGDTRLGFGYLSTTNGTEAKQATKYGIQGVNVEICDTFWAHGTKSNPEATLSAFTMSRGAEVYVNFLLTAFGVYDPKDKALYGNP